MEYAIAALVFGCIFMLVLGLSMSMGARPAERRLASLSTDVATPSKKPASMVRSAESGMVSLFRKLGERQGTGDVGSTRQRFIQAGFKNPTAPAIYYGVRLSLAVGLPVLAGLFPIVWSLPPVQQLMVLILLTAVGYVGPSIYVDQRLKGRKNAITRALPDALDLMVVCVEAGLGINQALARVAMEFESKSPILASEFSLVGHEARAGKTTTEALRGLAERTGVSDVSSLVALLVQTERFGTSVANALRVHADAMRIRRMQQAEERAQQATLKLILPSTMIFAALLLIFLAPGMYNFIGVFSEIE
jgi:tight adherence protein C